MIHLFIFLNVEICKQNSYHMLSNPSVTEPGLFKIEQLALNRTQFKHHTFSIQCFPRNITSDQAQIWCTASTC